MIYDRVVDVLTINKDFIRFYYNINVTNGTFYDDLYDNEKLLQMPFTYMICTESS